MTIAASNHSYPDVPHGLISTGNGADHILKLILIGIIEQIGWRIRFYCHINPAQSTSL